MEKLIIIRHGETAKNVAGKLHSTDDLEQLTEIGIEQIKKTVEKLREYAPAVVFSSKEPRAIQSGEIISKEFAIPFETIDGMQERNWGEFSGKSWSEVQVILDPMSLEERYKFIPPGGESWEQFENRLIKAISNIMEANPNQNIVVVTHGGAIRALIPYLLSAPKEESFKYNPENASITVFNKSDGTLNQELVNDTGHLNK